jgi:hypothetical protein
MGNEKEVKVAIVATILGILAGHSRHAGFSTQANSGYCGSDAKRIGYSCRRALPTVHLIGLRSRLSVFYRELLV